jgi:hypothetical protein
MFEHKSDPLISSRHFRQRLTRHSGYAGAIVGASLVFGTLGFWKLAHQPPVDALLTTAMLLGGMGPVGPIESTPGKLFAAGFALYAGLVFLVAGALILTPALHRLLHRFHLEEIHRAVPPRRSQE